MIYRIYQMSKWSELPFIPKRIGASTQLLCRLSSTSVFAVSPRKGLTSLAAYEGDYGLACLLTESKNSSS